MASEDSDRARGAVGTQTGTSDPADPSGRFSLDDFRLRLDSPLFHRDPGVATAEPPANLRELTWEHVVRAPETEPAPTVADFRAQLIPAPALPPMPLFTPQQPAVEALVVVEQPVVAEQPVVGELPVLVQPVATPEPPSWMATLDEVLANSGYSVPEAAVEYMAATPPVAAPEPMVEPLAEQIAVEEPVFSPSITPPSTPAIEAELNRLAFLPDIEEPVGPVEVPRIITSDQPVTPAPFVPSLSQHELYAPRSSPVAVAPRRNYADLAASMTPPSRRNKRHPVRRFFATVVLLGLLGGGLFAAKYYFLDQRWTGDTKPLAAEVETARGLTFDHAVEVTTLPAADYAKKLVGVTFGINDGNLATVAGEWRALGLLSGPLDTTAIGMAGLAEAPAFYDAGAEKIYVVEGVPADLRRFALQRALTMALLDQEYGWGGRVADASPAVARGTRALYDADALATATSLLDNDERVNLLTQQQTLYTAYQIQPSTVPFATAAATRAGLALRPFFDGSPAAARELVERNALITDAQAFDLRRLTAGLPETTSAQAEGMLFWYHVLAARIDNEVAWRTAMAWRGDDVSVVAGSAVCVTALVQVDPGSLDYAVGAFQAWAAGAPAAGRTAVTAVAGSTTGQITVTACDPGDATPTNDGRIRLSLGGAPLRSEQFRQLQIAYPQLTAQQLACAAYGGDAVSPADERSLVDPLEGWAALGAHAAADPNAAGCTA